MATHLVRQGECFASIAKRHGFDWRTLYDAQTADFKKLRPNPNLLFPGDQITIPRGAAAVVRCPAGQSHKFVVKLPKTKLRLRLKDHAGQGLAGKQYTLVVGGKTLSGTTAGDGAIVEPVPPDVSVGELTLFYDPQTELKMTLRFGQLDPVGETTGVQARLRHLGHFGGEIDGQESLELEASLRTFQKQQGLGETGTMDDPTRAKLESLHDR